MHLSSFFLLSLSHLYFCMSYVLPFVLSSFPPTILPSFFYQMMHGGAAGRPIAAAVRDGGGASASFCATRRAPLWSDRQVSRPTASNRPGVGNAVPEAEEHLREIDLAKIDISGSSARRFERWRQERIRVAEDARIVVGGAKWNRARVERCARACVRGDALFALRSSLSSSHRHQ